MAKAPPFRVCPKCRARNIPRRDTCVVCLEPIPRSAPPTLAARAQAWAAEQLRRPLVQYGLASLPLWIAVVIAIVNLHQFCAPARPPG